MRWNIIVECVGEDGKQSTITLGTVERLAESTTAENLGVNLQEWLNSNKGTKCDIESGATRMLSGGVQLCNLQFLSALTRTLTASFALRPGDRSESS
jgi:hypothetical protein